MVMKWTSTSVLTNLSQIHLHLSKKLLRKMTRTTRRLQQLFWTFYQTLSTPLGRRTSRLLSCSIWSTQMLNMSSSAPKTVTKTTAKVQKRGLSSTGRPRSEWLPLLGSVLKISSSKRWSRVWCSMTAVPESLSGSAIPLHHFIWKKITTWLSKTVSFTRLHPKPIQP